MEDGGIRYPGSSSTIGDQLLEGDCSRNLKSLWSIHEQALVRGKPKENWETGSFYHGLTRSETLTTCRHFWVAWSLYFKVRLSEKPLIWKWYLLSSRYHSFSLERFCTELPFIKWEFVKFGNSLCPVGSLKAARWRTGLKTTVVRSATRGWQQRAESVRKWRVSDAPSQSLPLLPLSLISNNLFFE